MANRSRLAVILHADIVGSTRIVQRDEHLGHERMQGAFRRLSRAITAHGGTTHELRGDALVAGFDRASDSVCAALTFQAENVAANAEHADAVTPALRIGIALGEVVIADRTVTGAGVVLAQRLEQLARPGGVVVQGAAYETIPRRLPFEYAFLGEQLLKGFDEPVRAYAVSLAANASMPAPQPRSAVKEPEAEAAAHVTRSQPSIAVLPFENMSGDPEQEYFSDGISEDIITGLSRIRQIAVIARNTTFTYKGRAVDVQRVARELGVRYVLEGSVRKSGDRVRITAQLIDGETASHLWAERYDRQLEDVFAVQDEITLTVVAAIEPELDRAEQERALQKKPESLDAWDYVQQGYWHLYKFTPQAHSKADECFRRALELAPEFGRAHSALATSNLIAYFVRLANDSEGRLATAFDFARKAIELDDRDAIAHSILGFVLGLRREHSAAAEALERALSINPSLARAHHWLGFVYAFDHRETDAISKQQTAMQLSPSDPLLWGFMNVCAYAHFNLGQYEDAGHWAKRAASQKNAPFSSRLTLAASQAQLGHVDAAKRTVDELLRMTPGFTVAAMRTMLPFKTNEDAVPWVEALEKAGLPSGASPDA